MRLDADVHVPVLPDGREHGNGYGPRHNSLSIVVDQMGQDAVTCSYLSLTQVGCGQQGLAY